jgi:hypothetical protein
MLPRPPRGAGVRIVERIYKYGRVQLGGRCSAEAKNENDRLRIKRDIPESKKNFTFLSCWR